MCDKSFFTQTKAHHKHQIYWNVLCVWCVFDVCLCAGAQYLCPRWRQRWREQYPLRSRASPSRQRSTTAVCDEPSCRPNPRPHLCVPTAPPAAPTALQQTQTHTVTTHTLTETHRRLQGTGTHRTSRTGRCWGSACSSTGCSRPNRRWNTAHRWSSSPHTEPDPWDQTTHKPHQTAAGLSCLSDLNLTDTHLWALKV